VRVLYLAALSIIYSTASVAFGGQTIACQELSDSGVAKDGGATVQLHLEFRPEGTISKTKSRVTTTGLGREAHASPLDELILSGVAQGTRGIERPNTTFSLDDTLGMFDVQLAINSAQILNTAFQGVRAKLIVAQEGADMTLGFANGRDMNCQSASEALDMEIVQVKAKLR